ncbi:MAG: hypothetical protein H0X34_19655 [Chthoniobacterales bacterium]|nr:hypothetical protein [Chthoniobacterales bacterium]
MRVRHLIITTVLAGLPLFGNAAAAARIEVIETFDFPGVGKLTEPQKINDRGDIVGTVIDAATGVSKGFYRSRNGQFSRPFVEPNDTGGLTNGRGINNARVICGNYTDGSDGRSHGYLLAGHVFTSFDVPDASETLPFGINNAGDVAGTLVASDGVTQSAFLSVGGAVTIFAIPDAAATLAYQVNDSNQTAGFYFDADSVTHGFLRASDGTLTYPIEPEGATATALFGNNDSNWVVGRYTDAAGVTHGLFFVTPDELVTFDYPGSTFTSLNGINAQGYITGRYVDADGGEHGILAKVHLDGTSKPSNALPAKVTKPVLSSPTRSGIGAPAM